MSGVALTTISPSSTSSRRSTPCVEGCCGPIEIVICESSGRSTTSNCGGMLAVETLIVSHSSYSSHLSYASYATHGTNETFGTDSSQGIRFISTQRKILAQRVPLPIFRKKDAPQVSMSIENHSE